MHYESIVNYALSIVHCALSIVHYALIKHYELCIIKPHPRP